MSGNFEIIFPRIAQGMVKAAKRGMGKAVMQALTDATIDIPATPHWRGVLRGSGSALVDSRMVAKNNDPTGQAEPADTMPGIQATDEIVGTVGFNTVYAHRMHEGLHFNFRTPGTGAKYLETKFLANQNLYFQIISNEVANP